MKPKVPRFSFRERAAEKAVTRAEDEVRLSSGEVSHADMARSNGGRLRGGRYKGPQSAFRRLQPLCDPMKAKPESIWFTHRLRHRCDAPIPSRRNNAEILSSPRNPARTMRIFS